MSARITRSVGSRARSAHSARVIDESGDHKNHSPDPEDAAAAAAAAAVAAATAARGEAGSATLVCVEFHRRAHVWRTRVSTWSVAPSSSSSSSPPFSYCYSATDLDRRSLKLPNIRLAFVCALHLSQGTTTNPGAKAKEERA